jgi:hypothetical protein
MAHFAEINENNTVLRVLVVPDAQEHRGQDFLANDLNLGGTWIQCSYNNNIRKQYPGIGYTYYPDADVFVAPQQYVSWTLDANHDWQPPTPMPDDDNAYYWDEPSQTWQAADSF